MDSNKKWYASKTLWTNFLAIVVIVAQGAFGWVVSPEYQIAALGVVNFVLRLVTRSPVEW